MKVVYCDRCKDISFKSRLEAERCNTCGRAARTVPFRRPWQYWASSGVLLVAVVLLLAVPIPDILVRIAILAPAAALAFVLASWSLRTMRTRILSSVARDLGEPREARP